MDKIDLVLVGSEAVVESGGLINAVGSYQTAIIAKAANKPLYALAERSVHFLLGVYDLANLSRFVSLAINSSDHFPFHNMIYRPIIQESFQCPRSTAGQRGKRPPEQQFRVPALQRLPHRNRHTTALQFHPLQEGESLVQH